MKKVETVKLTSGLLRGLGRALSLAALLLAAWYGLRPAPLSAEVPVKFTYQGNLRQGGFLVNGSRSMVFRIYDSSSSAVELWTSPAYNVQLSTGVFRVTLAPVLSDWQTGNLWLEMEVEGNRMSPREEVTSSPYSINSMLISGKRYTTAASAPAAFATGDLWMDTVSGNIKFWNGSVWMLTSGSGIPGVHAFTHTGGGSDPIINLGTHTVSGSITFDNFGELRAANNVMGVTIATHAIITGSLNPASNLLVGGAGYTVTFASSVIAGNYYGDGSGLTNLNANNVTLGYLTGDHIGAGVLVSSHIAAGSINRTRLNQSGCANGQVFKWDNASTQWICADDNFSGSGSELDPISVHNQDTLQANTTFYVSSGTVNYLIVNNKLDVFGPAAVSVPGNGDFQKAFGVFTPQVPNGLHGGQLQFGLQDLANKAAYLGFVGGALPGDEYISIGIKNAEDILSIKGDRKVGIGTNDPWEPLEIYKNGGGGGIRFNSPGVAEYKMGIPFGESYLRIGNTNALSKGQYVVQGLTMDSANNVGLGGAAVNSKFAVLGNDAQAYSVAIGTGTAPYQVVVTTSGAMGIGTALPQARLEVSGPESSGAYTMLLKSGTKVAAWLKNNAAANGTEFGVEDNFEVKGFSVMGPLAGPQKIAAAPGNMVLRGNLQADATAYFGSSVAVAGYGVLQSTVQFTGNTGALTNLFLDNAGANVGKVLKASANGFLYWASDNSGLTTIGNPFRLQMVNSTSDGLVDSMFLQNAAGTNITMISGSSFTVNDMLALSDVNFRARFNVEGASTLVSSVTAKGNTQFGDAVSDIHGINKIPEAGVGLAVDSDGASGSYVAKFYSGGVLAAWIKRK